MSTFLPSSGQPCSGKFIDIHGMCLYTFVVWRFLSGGQLLSEQMSSVEPCVPFASFVFFCNNFMIKICTHTVLLHIELLWGFIYMWQPSRVTLEFWTKLSDAHIALFFCRVYVFGSQRYW
jgi:hypothetical protein